MNIGLDSMIVIYAGMAPSKAAAQSDQLKELVLRAKLLFHEHQEDVIFLPTIAVSEILVPVAAAQRGLLATKLSEKFVCPPFDMPAASIAADLWARHKTLPDDKQQKERQVLRADTMIIASAKAAGATRFYSHDKKCRALAELIMEARDLPKKPDGSTPHGLFLAAAYERGDMELP